MHDADYTDALIDLAFLQQIAEYGERTSAITQHDDVRFMRWLERDARTRQSLHERAQTAEAAAMFAHRTRAKIQAATMQAALPVAPLRVRQADVVGTVGQIASVASHARCAPWLDSLAVAAGLGREVWDEPCDRWVELPKGVARAEYVALNVAGDSMLPVLLPGDVLLVRTGKPAKVGALVVALHPDHGYVVKHVARVEPAGIELVSFNPEYAPLRIENDPALILGIVSRVLRRPDRSDGCNADPSM